LLKIAIIGAGMSGLSAAHLLRDYAEVTIFEKSRGVGGRMSTRHASPYSFDHGAQYFTARTNAFQDFIKPIIKEGIVNRWDARYVKFHHNHIIEREHWNNDIPRYVGAPDMNSVVKYIADGFKIHLNTRVTSLERKNNWTIMDDNNLFYNDFDWVILTIPSPQLIDIMPPSFKFFNEVKLLEMQACFALMLGFSEKIISDFDAAHIIDSDISWIAVNSSKPGRSGSSTLVVHSSTSYADNNTNGDIMGITNHLCNESSKIVGFDVNLADHKALHFWRYANNTKHNNHPLFLDPKINLAVCGDWCSGGRVEGAFTSSYNLTNAMKSISL
jgi:renalase